MLVSTGATLLLVTQGDTANANEAAGLSILVTHPTYQRRGAGGMLVKWGCDKADERGLMSALIASTAGLGVYLKHGFEVVQEAKLDLHPYGVEEVELRRGMIRPAAPKQR